LQDRDDAPERLKLNDLGTCKKATMIVNKQYKRIQENKDFQIIHQE
jgi:hypothetical protein